MGRSLHKYHISLHDTTNKAECLLTVLPADNTPWQLSSETQKSYFNNTLLALKHPYVLPILAIDSLKEKDKVAVVRSLSQKGSLLDYIYKTKPVNSCDKKYIAGTKKQTLDAKLLAKWSKQVLEGMLYLHAQGFPVTFVHSGNIIIQGENCCISDVENTLLGLQTSIPQPATPQLALASVLYEMGTGVPLPSTATAIPSDQSALPAALVDVIKSLIAAAHSSPPPTFESVANLPFFSGVSTNVTKLDKKMLAYIKKYVGKNRAEGEEMSKKARLLKQQSSSAGLVAPATTGATSPSSSPPPQRASSSQKQPTPAPPAPPPAPTGVPPPPPAGAPPPPPPPAPAGVPAPQAGRASLLDSIRNPNNMKKLKKVSAK
jgi:PX domain-containing protein kinase-like protein